MKSIIIILLVVISTAQASAQESTFGTGVMVSKCSRLLGGIKEGNGIKQPLAFAMLTWTEGYITGVNITIEEGALRYDLGSMTRVEIWASLYGFCKRNPDQLGIAATIETMGKLNRKILE